MEISNIGGVAPDDDFILQWNIYTIKITEILQLENHRKVEVKIRFRLEMSGDLTRRDENGRFDTVFFRRI